jgi:ribose transport system substrate-binding protein
LDAFAGMGTLSRERPASTAKGCDFMRRIWPAALALLAVDVLLIPGCGGGKSSRSEPVRIALVGSDPAEFPAIVRRGAEKAAAEFDVDVEFHSPKDRTPAEQRTIVEGLLANGIKAIAISPSDAVGQAEFLEGVAERIPLVAQDSDLPSGSRRACYIGADNYESGRAAGQLVKEAMPEGGRVVVLAGQVNVQIAQERRRGLRDELIADATTPGRYALIDAHAEDTPQDACRTLVNDALAKYGSQPEQLCLVCLWICKAPAALSAIKQARLEGKVRLVGFDVDEETLQGVKDKTIYGAVGQRPFEVGYETVKIMARLARGDHSNLPETGVMFLDPQVITADNVDDYLAELKKSKQ